MNFFADILSSLFDRKLGLANRVEDDNKPIDDLCQALLSSRGDVSGMSLAQLILCLLYTSPSPRDRTRSRMPSSA